jgi:WbqC-like protein family
MKLAIMQPYLFPYLGYFQLLTAVDAFVIHDDVQYIKGGWINRNRILLNGKPAWVTLPVKHGQYDLDINQRVFSEPFTDNKRKLLRKIESAYLGAPQFNSVLELLKNIFTSRQRNISLFILDHLKMIGEYAGIDTPVYLSSRIPKNNGLRGQDRVIEIARRMAATHYINPVGGIELYNREVFLSSGIELSFLRIDDVRYPQFGDMFIPDLSIIDVLMFNGKDMMRRLLTKFELV